MSLLQHGYTQDNLKFLIISNVTNLYSEYHHLYIKYSSLLKYKSQDNTRIILIDEGNKGILMLETFMNIASLKVIESKGLDVNITIKQVINYLKDTIKTVICSYSLANYINFKLFFYNDVKENIPSEFKLISNSKNKDIFENYFLIEQKEFLYNFNFQSDWNLITSEVLNTFTFDSINTNVNSPPASTFTFNPNSVPNQTSVSTFNQTPFSNNNSVINQTSVSTFNQNPFPNNSSINQTPVPNNNSVLNQTPVSNNNNNKSALNQNQVPTFNHNPFPNNNSVLNQNQVPTFNQNPFPNNSVLNQNQVPTFNQNPFPNNNSALNQNPFPNNNSALNQNQFNTQPCFNVNPYNFNNPTPTTNSTMFNWNTTTNKDTKPKKIFTTFSSNPLNN
jgi:hypothetical protein